MAQWYVKELSKLTHVSVQTLHHYDRIGLLKPSLRLENRYRLYSEKDLLKLQQIIALKFFGFDLTRIKYLLSNEKDMLTHLVSQSKFLEQEANMLLDASKTLTSIIEACNKYESIPWQRIIQSIEVYTMTKKMDTNWLWLAKSLTVEELKEYAEFENELKTKRTLEDKERFEKSWAQILTDINANLERNPASEIGIDIAERCKKRVDELYFNKYHKLRKSIWEKGFKGDSSELKHGLTPEAVKWLDGAFKAYYFKRLGGIFSKLDTHSEVEVKEELDNFLVEKCGDDQESQLEFIHAIINHENCMDKTKQWLIKNYL